MDNKDQAKGKIEQAVGDLTDNEELKKQGEVDEKAGKVKAFVEEIKDTIDDVVDKVKDKLTKH